MRILVTGSTGLVGGALIPALEAQGHEVLRLVRSEPQPGEARWDPAKGTIDASALEGLDGAVHLAGENIAEGRWTDEKKRRILESRVEGTKLLSESLAGLAAPPKVLVSASAIGFYGNRGAEILTEQSASGDDFLSEVCREWELATRAAAEKGMRVVHLRFGVILSEKGGALAKMLTPFKLGAGGRVGDGTQYMSWIDLEDVAGAIMFALKHDELRGPVNVVAPEPVTNQEFTKAMGNVLSRPTILPMPSFVARLAFGEMADALLLSSARVEPARLKEAGYVFKYPQLEDSLQHNLK